MPGGGSSALWSHPLARGPRLSPPSRRNPGISGTGMGRPVGAKLLTLPVTAVDDPGPPMADNGAEGADCVDAAAAWRAAFARSPARCWLVMVSARAATMAWRVSSWLWRVTSSATRASTLS